MPLYKYKVTDSLSRLTEQLVEAESQAEAVRRLQRRDLMPVACLGEEASHSNTKAAPFWRKKFDIVDFTDRLTSLLEAHVPLEKALAIIAEGCDKKNREVVESLWKGMHEGRRLSQMLRDRSAIFPPIYVGLVEVGEEAGALPRMMADLRDFLINRQAMKTHIVSVSIYPMVVLAVSILVLGVLFGVILPRFASVFEIAGHGLDGSMATLLAIADTVRSFWWLPLMAAAALVGSLRRLKQRPGFAMLLDRSILKIPLLKNVIILANLTRLNRTMAILMRSDVHILETVKISSRILQNRAIRESLSTLAADLRKGERLADALGRSEYVPPDMLRMLAIGEETGELGRMLEKIGERYERDFRKTIQRSLSLLEPALILSLGIVIAVIVLVMFLAIIEIQGGF